MRRASKTLGAFRVVPRARAPLVIAAPPAHARPDRPTPGAPGGGDPLFPGLGNGGYDVRHYTVDLAYGSAASVQTVPGVVTIQRARRSRCLASTSISQATPSTP